MSNSLIYAINLLRKVPTIPENDLLIDLVQELDNQNRSAMVLNNHRQYYSLINTLNPVQCNIIITNLVNKYRPLIQNVVWGNVSQYGGDGGDTHSRLLRKFGIRNRDDSDNEISIPSTSDVEVDGNDISLPSTSEKTKSKPPLVKPRPMFRQKVLRRETQTLSHFILDKNNKPVFAEENEWKEFQRSDKKYIAFYEEHGFAINTYFDGQSIAHFFKTKITHNREVIEIYKNPSYNDAMITHTKAVKSLKKAINLMPKHQ
jgi:hypothetical protein